MFVQIIFSQKLCWNYFTYLIILFMTPFYDYKTGTKNITYVGRHFKKPRHVIRWRSGKVISIHANAMSCKQRVESKLNRLNDTGIETIANGFTFRNRMFVVYDKHTNCVITDQDTNPELLNATIIPVDENTVIFLAPDSNSFRINLKDFLLPNVVCVTSFCNKFRVTMHCVDMGDEAARWISKYLDRDNLRLGFAKHNRMMRGNFSVRCLSKYLESSNFDEERFIEFNEFEIPSLAVMSITSAERLNNYPVEAYPANIILRNFLPFIEDNWIGVNLGLVIIQNLKPYGRSKIYEKALPVDMRIRMLLLHAYVHSNAELRNKDDVVEKDYKQIPVIRQLDYL